MAHTLVVLLTDETQMDSMGNAFIQNLHAAGYKEQEGSYISRSERYKFKTIELGRSVSFFAKQRTNVKYRSHDGHMKISSGWHDNVRIYHVKLNMEDNTYWFPTVKEYIARRDYDE